MPSWIKRAPILGLWTFSSLITSLFVAWLVLAPLNFLYPIWHDVGGIGAGIDKYGPKNRFKPGFGDTTRAQRTAIFAEINRAVHFSGEGLTEIIYQTPSSEGEQTLLHDAEVVHLQDVANLIDLMKWVVAFGVLVFVGLSVYLLKRANLRLSWKSQGFSVLTLLSVIGLVLVVFGSKNVFNQLHIWVFPDDHQWFFYYQESLMSTLMLAPTLFGWIAASLALLGLGFWLVLVQITLVWQRRRIN